MARTIHADGRTVSVPDDATPEEINQIFGAAPAAAVASGGNSAMPVQPVANHGLGSAWDTVAAPLNTLGGMASGAYHAFTDPATKEELAAAPGAPLNSTMGHIAMGAKRMLIDPSIRSFQEGEAARKSGDINSYNGAVAKYAQALPIVGPMEKQLVDTAEQKGALPAVAGLATNLLAAKGAGRVVRAVAAPAEMGAALQDSGLGRIGRYLGQGPKDEMYGANPARAVVNDVQGIPLSRSSLSKSLNAAQPVVGQQLGDTIRAADTNPNAAPITKQSVAPAIRGPVATRSAEIMGPGGSGVVAPLNALQQSFNESAPGATAPIAGPIAPAQVMPTDLWKTIQNVDKNTKFNPDPEVEGVNEVRRSIRGGLRQQLETADPNIKPLSRRYGDIRGAQDVLERNPNANQGIPLSVANAVGRTLNAAPVQVGLGKMAVATGRGLSTAGKVLNPAIPSAAIGNAAVVGALGSGNAVVNQNTDPNNGEVSQPNGDQGQQNPADNLQDQHGAPSIPPAFHPDTHTFSTGEWLKGNPGGDPDEAREHAESLGFTVTD